MKIIDLLDPKCILPDLQAANKRGVLEELATALVSGHKEVTLQAVVEVLLERERLGSTGIGDNIAIPHGKLPQLSRMLLGFGRSLKGVDFDSMDGKPSHLFFLLLAPVNSSGLHLKALAKISRMLMSQTFREGLMESKGAEEILRLIEGKDAEF
ncbi:MAG: PTS fructose transporter subunit IIA [Deltaproteobacteria bacterium RBG_13_60_28]|jgi:PTS system nitrogen regulatory IIA component|nr:MAG: PTS fructose transporter subunit IIA [Deltaproteobacteria bacterium RBG_13_60_28]